MEETTLRQLLEDRLGFDVPSLAVCAAIASTQARLKSDPEYKKAFEKEYGTSPTAYLLDPINKF